MQKIKKNVKRRKSHLTPAIIIVHGDSEKQLITHIKTYLKLNLKIHSGTTSIQINGILKELNTYYKNANELEGNGVYVPIKKGKIDTEDFKIFIIMDTDDCTEDTKNKYINGKLFEQYALKDRVVPIYNNSTLEEVLKKAGIIDKIYGKSEKMKNYTKIFPKLEGNESKPEDIRRLADKLRTVKETNIEILIDYLIEIYEKNNKK